LPLLPAPVSGMVRIRLKFLFLAFLLSWPAAFSCFAKYGGGEGTAEQPYLIYTAEQMNQIGIDSDDWGKHFALMADIDLSGFAGEPQFNLIGSTTDPFSGVFDGRGHTISGFTYQGDGISYEIGLFRVVDGEEAVIKNLGLIDPNISGAFLVSTLAALLNDGRIENCWVTGGSVYAEGMRAGGLAGEISAGMVLNCYTSDTSVDCTTWAGGLTGVNTGGLIINSYAANPVSATPMSSYVGAFVGEGAGGTYTGCFYDNQINPTLTGIGDGNDPYGLMSESTANLKLGATFADAGWDIVTSDNQPVRNIWRMCTEGDSYPRLAAEYLTADFACPDGIDFYDLAVLSDEWMVELLGADVDFNLDGQVNFRDWAILAAAWKSQRGSDDYNTIVDVYPTYGDGVIDEYDAALFTEFWLGRGSAYLNADIEPYGGDGVVDFVDFAAFANQWFEGK
jgi:hypothetical protein